jgi:DNA invertase Pin-like site-specific DNA recombinase
MKKSKRKRLSPQEVFYHTILHRYRDRADRENAKISEFIEHFAKVIRDNPNIPIVGYVRVSTPAQKSNGNLSDQLQDLLKKLKRIRANNIVHVFFETRNGSIFKKMPRELLNACKLAREIGGVVVAVSPDRIIRSHYFNPRKMLFLEPVLSEMEMFRSITRRTKIATIEDPDVTNSKAHSSHTKRGMQEKDKMGGRPRKSKPRNRKKQRQENIDIILAKREEGMSYRALEKELDIPRSTICGWCRAVSER